MTAVENIDRILEQSQSRQDSMRRRSEQYKSGNGAGSRHFSSSAVTADKVPHIMLMYGTDESGIRARIDSIVEAMSMSGMDMSVYQSFSDAESMMSSTSSLFGSDDCVLIKDASDLVQGKDAEKHIRVLDEYLDSVGTDTKTVICITSSVRSQKLIALLRESVTRHGGRVVERDKPEDGGVYEWVSTYASDMGYSLSSSKLSELVSLTKDANDATSLIDQLGNALERMSYNDIAMSLKSVKKSAFWEYQNAVAACDAQTLIKMRKTMPYTKDGTITFLISCRSALNDIIKMSLDDTNGMSKYASYQAKHGFRTNLYAVRKTRDRALRSGGADTFVPMYVRLCNLMERMTFDSYMPTDSELGVLFSTRRTSAI